MSKSEQSINDSNVINYDILEMLDRDKHLCFQVRFQVHIFILLSTEKCLTGVSLLHYCCYIILERSKVIIIIIFGQRMLQTYCLHCASKHDMVLTLCFHLKRNPELGVQVLSSYHFTKFHSFSPELLTLRLQRTSSTKQCGRANYQSQSLSPSF